MSELGQQIIAKVREIAAEQPDFVYHEPPGAVSCVYVHDGRPSCIIGQALWALGLIDATLEHDETPVLQPGTVYSPAKPNKVTSRDLFKHLGIEVDTEEAKWLRAVQSFQDSQFCWLLAVERADDDVLVPA